MTKVVFIVAITCKSSHCTAGCILSNLHVASIKGISFAQKRHAGIAAGRCAEFVALVSSTLELEFAERVYIDAILVRVPSLQINSQHAVARTFETYYYFDLGRNLATSDKAEAKSSSS